MMKRTAVLVAGLLLVSTTATAGPNWQTIGFSISPEDVPTVVAAFDRLISSASADLTGNVALMANVVGGDDSPSHTIISSFDTRAEREKWVQGLLASPAWIEFAQATSGLARQRGSARMNFVKSWGEESDKDVFWEIYALTVSEPDELSGALDDFLASDTGKQFPGQVHLSVVAAAGVSPVTHLISVGFESEAEAETWADSMLGTKDWAAYQKASEKVSTTGGAFMLRTIKTWGNTSN